jgi:hypothetical protein
MTEKEKKTKIKTIAGNQWWLEAYLMNSCNINTRWTKRSRENVKKDNPKLCKAIEEYC